MVSDYEGSFGVPLTYEFAPGQRAHLAFQVRGFQSAATERDQYRRAALTYTIEAVDCSGRLLTPPHSGEVEKVIGPRERDWAPAISYAVDIPSTPQAGTHNFRIRVQDTVGGTATHIAIPFEVQSQYDEPNPNLSVERFRFYSSERVREPVEGPPVFRPLDEIWGRFVLSGFRTDAGNRYQLQYGVSVRNPAGRVLLNEPRAAAESKESFYPKTHVPGVISVVLERAIRPGSYFLVLSAVDSIGKQQVKVEYPFRVSE